MDAHVLIWLTWPHHLTKKGGWEYKTSLIPPLFNWSTCTKPGKWASCVLLVSILLCLFLWFWKLILERFVVLFYSILILVNHASTKPVISRYPVNWKHESTVVLNWKSDEMNFPLNLIVNVDLYYPKVGDLFGLSLAVLLLLVFLFFYFSSTLLLLYYEKYCFILINVAMAQTFDW